MRIKIDQADKWFSLYIRERDDWSCRRCKTKHKRFSGGLHNSHYFGRSAESTRFEPKNCDALCFACHLLWGGDRREEYMEFKKKQLTPGGLNKLIKLHNTYKKKDRKREKDTWRKAYRELCINKKVAFK